MDGRICEEICPLLPMMQAIQLYSMDLNNGMVHTYVGQKLTSLTPP